MSEARQIAGWTAGLRRQKPAAGRASLEHPWGTKMDFETIVYEIAAPHVARIVLNRPEARNAQNTRLLYELNAAFDRAAQDDAVKVVILAANGPHFSSGHDLREPREQADMSQYQTVGTWCGFGCAGAEARMAREKEIYLGFSERWRNMPKPTIAQVHGKCIAGGLMLAWPCDLIVASDDASFMDNTVSMGVGGAEFFAHPWEVGVRKAKEMLFTADALTAQDAHRLGMVNHVVPADEVADFVLELARKIAAKPLFALKLAKEAVNAAQDAQGRVSAMSTSFALHQLAHSHNMQVHGFPIDPTGAGISLNRPEPAAP
jgi:enoyl-CoA hydratase